MNSYPFHGYPRRFEAAIRRWFDNGRPEGKVPAWTPEDEANLRQRVERLAPKAKP